MNQREDIARRVERFSNELLRIVRAQNHRSSGSRVTIKFKGTSDSDPDVLVECGDWTRPGENDPPESSATTLQREAFLWVRSWLGRYEVALEQDINRAMVGTVQLPVRAKPLESWGEDDGAVLRWKFPVDEAPYCGSPLDSDWPAYHTHWTPLPPVPVPE